MSNDNAYDSPLTSLPLTTILNGPNPLEMSRCDDYTELGALVTDDTGVNETISQNIIITNQPDVSKTGTYTVAYNVTDESGNSAVQVVRTVIVQSNKYDNAGLIGNKHNGRYMIEERSKLLHDMEIEPTEIVEVNKFVEIEIEEGTNITNKGEIVNNGTIAIMYNSFIYNEASPGGKRGRIKNNGVFKILPPKDGFWDENE